VSEVVPQATESCDSAGRTHLLSQLDKVLGALVVPRPTTEHRPDGKREQQDLEERPPGVVLVRVTDVAHEDGRSGDAGGVAKHEDRARATGLRVGSQKLPG
jgi:hypothetical protein